MDMPLVHSDVEMAGAQAQHDEDTIVIPFKRVRREVSVSDDGSLTVESLTSRSLASDNFIVRRVIGSRHRRNRDGIRDFQYLLQWEGHTHPDWNWLKDCTCPLLIDKFHTKNPDQPRPQDPPPPPPNDSDAESMSEYQLK
jgi:hypothetical protein